MLCAQIFYYWADANGPGPGVFSFDFHLSSPGLCHYLEQPLCNQKRWNPGQARDFFKKLLFLSLFLLLGQR